jgi:hypothetical protein
MKYIFEYEGIKHTTNDVVEMEQFVFQWIDDNSQAFMEYSNNKLGYSSKDNYEAAVERFFEDTVTEERS